MNKPPEIIPTEQHEQERLFCWAELMGRVHPELWLLNASLNGVRLHRGSRAKAKRCGMKKGYPDIFLPVARGGYHGLFIELKRLKGGRLEPEQAEWKQRLADGGYMAIVAKGWVQASRVIEGHLKL